MMIARVMLAFAGVCATCMAETVAVDGLSPYNMSMDDTFWNTSGRAQHVQTVSRQSVQSSEPFTICRGTYGVSVQKIRLNTRKPSSMVVSFR